MISDPKNLSEQLCNLSERLGIEMRTLNRTKVSTVNGLIPDNSGAITVDVGVTSFNGSKGAVTYTAPVTSVNGKTGAVTVDVGVKKVNGVTPDSNGNVTIQTGGDTSNLVPKTGDRGNLAGYERFNATLDMESTSPATLTINESSSDVSVAIANNVVVENGVDIGFLPFYVGTILGGNPDLFSPNAVSWTKVVLLLVESTVTLGTRWIWANNELPDITPGGLLILHWNAEFGVANFLSFNGAFDEMCGKYFNGEL